MMRWRRRDRELRGEVEGGLGEIGVVGELAFGAGGAFEVGAGVDAEADGAHGPSVGAQAGLEEVEGLAHGVLRLARPAEEEGPEHGEAGLADRLRSARLRRR